MSEFVRLVDDPAANSFDRDLLDEWRRQGPSPAAVERAMGLAAVAGAATAAAAGATAAAAGATEKAATLLSASVPPKAAAVGAGLLVKWVVMTSAIVAMTALGAGAYLRRSSGPPTVPHATVAPPVEAPPTDRSPPPAPEAVPVESLPNARAAPTVGTTKRPVTPSRAAGTSALEQQIASMDRIREAVASGDLKHALSLIDEYERRFPSGAFIEEAEVNRIETLVRLGDSAGANRAAERFLADHPSSPHTARVRSLIRSATP
jgi:hypothetical protein